MTGLLLKYLILIYTFIYNRFQIYEVSWLYLCTMSEWIIMVLMNFFFAKCTKQHQQRLNKLQVSLEKPVKFQRRYYSSLHSRITWIGVHIFGWKKPICMKGESIMRICSSSNFDEIIIMYGVFGWEIIYLSCNYIGCHLASEFFARCDYQNFQFLIYIDYLCRDHLWNDWPFFLLLHGIIFKKYASK